MLKIVLTKGTQLLKFRNVHFDWDNEKNKFLNSQRNISFERIVIEIEAGAVLDILENPNKETYPNQVLLIVNIDEYAWVVPAVESKISFFLKTAYPSRKFTNIYFPEAGK